VLRPFRFLSPALAFVHAHELLLWCLHSLWALALGVVVMWAGARNYALIRYTILYIAFLWVASLFVPDLVDPPGQQTRWRGRLRLVINYFSRTSISNCCSSCCRSITPARRDGRSTCFRGLPWGLRAASTFDVVYDRHLSVRRGLVAVFFAFNLFACIT